jgi:hypothetical protein
MLLRRLKKLTGKNFAAYVLALASAKVVAKAKPRKHNCK